MSEESKEKLPQPIAESEDDAKRRKDKIIGRVEQRVEAYYGLLPRPSDLREYNEIVPGAAERILSMAERQAAHRQNLERVVVFGDSRRSFYGLWAGFIVALCFLGGAVFLVFNGHEWAGTIVGGLDIVGLVSVFVIGSRSRKQERIEKAEIMNQPTDLEDS